jgi:hypothetical protein
MTMTDDPFEGCEIDEVMALVFDQTGPAGLQELLAMRALDRENLTTAASKLEAAGLLEAAKLVTEAAARAADPKASEIAAIFADPVRGNRRAYLAAMYRHGSVTMADLEAADVDKDTLAYIKRSRP